MKEVIIIHLSPGWQDCPFDAETWTCNTLYYAIQGRIDKLFLMHKQIFKGVWDVKIPVYDWDEINNTAKERDFEVIALHNIPQLKSTRYPYKEIVKYFQTNYFTCSACYMIAYALYHNYTKIRLYGVDFVRNISEYTDDLNERCGVEYWIGRAQERGVTVEIHNSTLLTTTTGKPYAIDG